VPLEEAVNDYFVNSTLTD